VPGKFNISKGDVQTAACVAYPWKIVIPRVETPLIYAHLRLVITKLRGIYFNHGNNSLFNGICTRYHKSVK